MPGRLAQPCAPSGSPGRFAAPGWTFPWYSSFGRDFNHDFHVTLDESVLPVEYNDRSAAEHEQAGTAGYVTGDQPIEAPGYSCFLREDDMVFHTYSMYARGAETLGGSYYFLDLTPSAARRP